MFGYLPKILYIIVLTMSFSKSKFIGIIAVCLMFFPRGVSGVGDKLLEEGFVNSPSDTVVVYDTVFKLSPHSRFPRSWVAAASWMPQSGESSYGLVGALSTEVLNTNRLSFGRQISLDAKSALRYRWLKADAHVGVGLREIYITSIFTWQKYSDQYIGGQFHVYEYGGTSKHWANYYTLGPELELHVQLGNFKKNQPRFILELNGGAYAYTAFSSTYRAIIDNYSIDWIYYDNGVREEVNYYYGSWVSSNQIYTGSDVQLHLNVRGKVYVTSGISLFGGYGGTVLLKNDIVANFTTLGLEYKFGTAFGPKE